MKTTFRLRPAAVACAVLLSLPTALRAEDEVQGWVLSGIYKGPNSASKNRVEPDRAEATAEGGLIESTLPYNEFGDGCSETYLGTWKFKSDIRVLRPGDKFEANVDAKRTSGADCNTRTIDISVWDSKGSGGPSILKELFPVTLPPQAGNTITGEWEYIRAEPASRGTSKLEVLDRNKDPEMIWFQVLLRGSTGRRGQNAGYTVVYVYTAFHGPKAPKTEYYPGEDDSAPDTPAPDDPAPIGPAPDGSGTRGSRPNAPPINTGGAPAELPPDVCGDPVSKRCIDEWINLATQLMNKHRKDMAPWHMNAWGQWIGEGPGGVNTSHGPPDGWATKYRGSRYCWVWAEFQEAHKHKDYRGELPALRDFIAKCLGGGTGSVTNVGPPQPADPSPAPGPGTNTGPGTMPAGGLRTLLAEKHLVKEGDQVTVPVWLYNPGAVASVNFDVTHNPSVAVPDGSVLRGSLLGGDTQFAAESRQRGVIRVGFAKHPGGFTRSGIVANLRFKAVGKAGQKTPLSLSVREIEDAGKNALPIRLVHGEIEIISASSGAPGDCDGDGQYSVTDALCALQMSVGTIPTDLKVDINGDGEVTASDAQTILQRIP